MARLQGISGGMSGRTGSFTYRQSRGQTIVSQYQPIVKNPNTKGQQDQRAKFKLMSQLAAVMSRGFGSFIIKTRPEKQRPTQRNAFVQLNMPLVEVDSSADKVTAKIPMEKIQLTSSYIELGNISGMEDSGDITVTITDVSQNVEYVQFVLLRSNADAAPQLLQVQRVERLTQEQTEFSLDFTNQTAGSYTILAFGLIPADGQTTANLNNIFNPANSLNEAAIQLNQLVSMGSLSETKTLGVNVVVRL